MRIGTFAARCGLSPDTIRYYERIGLMPPPPRDAGGRRSYGADELAWASFLCKLQVMDMPIRDRLAYGRLRAEGDATIGARLAILERHRADLVRRQAELADCVEVLDAKIDLYRGLSPAEEASRDEHGHRRDHRNHRRGPREPGR